MKQFLIIALFLIFSVLFLDRGVLAYQCPSRCVNNHDCGPCGDNNDWYCDKAAGQTTGHCQPPDEGLGGGGRGSKTCNQLCVQNSSCISGLSCVAVSGTVGKRCRAPNCQNDTSCGCVNVTPTPGGPTPTAVPTPTDNPNCKCNALKNCTTQCQFDKFSDVTTYPNTIKCGLADSVFQTVPTTDNKNRWCRAEKRTKGDADGDGTVTFKDYFYYVTAKLGFKIPASVNPDFNGDNVIDTKDRDIIIKSLLP